MEEGLKPYLHPKDAGLKFPRTVGKRRWKVAAVAKAAPHELDKVAEHLVHDQIEAEVQGTGLPYVSIREGVYAWLKWHAERGEGAAIALLVALKDFPDFAIFAQAEPGAPYCLCLPLELKKGKGGRAKPGQKRLAEALGGTIAKGYTEAHGALGRFLAALPKAPNRP